jgi:ribosomal protein S18 acetylase RimI-like enzyme
VRVIPSLADHTLAVGKGRVPFVAATDADRDRIYTLRRAAYFDLGVACSGVWDDVFQRNRFETRWTVDGAFLLVRDEEPIGAVELEVRDDDVFVRSIVVEPAFQGQGIGAVVLRAIRAGAAELGQAIALSVVHQNPRAQALYTRLGFVAVRADAERVWMRWERGA